MFNIGGAELFLVGLIALLVIKPENIPQFATALGRFIAEIRRGLSGVQKEIEMDVKKHLPKLPSTTDMSPSEPKDPQKP